MPSKSGSKAVMNYQDVRIIVLGSSGVGKSAVVMQFVRGIFVEAYDPTLEDSFSKIVNIKSGNNRKIDPINVEILDTAGTDQFAAMRDMYIANGDAFLLVYAIDSKASFNEVIELYNRIKKIRTKKLPIMIVGNKSDLPSKTRRVTYEQASYFAYQNQCSFMEVSARKNEKIEDAFMVILKQYVESKEFKRKSMASNSDNHYVNANANNARTSDENELKNGKSNFSLRKRSSLKNGKEKDRDCKIC